MQPESRKPFQRAFSKKLLVCKPFQRAFSKKLLVCKPFQKRLERKPPGNGVIKRLNV
jgi:hypothetical protein